MKRLWINLSFYLLFYSVVFMALLYGWLQQVMGRVRNEED